jgi:rhodanese-related sulfurtransferase
MRPPWVALVLAALLASSCQSTNRDAREPDVVLDVEPDSAGDEDPGEEIDLPPWPEDKYITPEEVHLRLEAGDPDMLPLNVSDEEFWSMGHIEGSVIVPWDLLGSRLDEVDAPRHVVVYCRRGVRSEDAHATLEAAGYDLLWVMSGGLEEWISLGYPTVP